MFDNVSIESNFEYGFYRHSPPLILIFILAYGLILILGIVGNALVVSVILTSPHMRTVTNLFILNLAVADFLVLLFCLPPTLISNILVPWVLGSLMCKTVPYVQGVSVCASVYSLLAVSMDRLIAIWFPLGRGLSKSQAKSIICIIWFCSCAISVPFPLLFEMRREEEEPHYEYCTENWAPSSNGPMLFLIANFSTCYLLPLIGITVCYLLIWLRVLKREVPTEGGGNLLRVHHKAKIGVLRMLIVVVFVFLLSWLPLYVVVGRLRMSESLSLKEEEILSLLLPFAQWLGSSNSCINPILYAYLNAKFRRAFCALIPCGNLRKSRILAVGGTKSSISLVQRQQTVMYTLSNGSNAA